MSNRKFEFPFKWFGAFFVVNFLLGLALAAGVIYVAIHFLIKLW